jgi:hypothetical protein
VGGFNGKAFLLGISHLDAASRRVFSEHGKSRDGRLTLVDHVVDEAMLRMAGADLDDDSLDREGH